MDEKVFENIISFNSFNYWALGTSVKIYFYICYNLVIFFEFLILTDSFYWYIFIQVYYLRYFIKL